MRQHTLLDKTIMIFDSLCFQRKADGTTIRKTPGEDLKEPPLSADEKKQVAGLMRVNHSGEVCAQALYQGQAITARLEKIREKMLVASEEEIDHLVWCEQRLKELDANVSILNPVWYTLSFLIGAIAGIAGDKWSLGFVAETEKQVSKHLEKHLQALPEQDNKSRAIINQMHIDENQHATMAMEAGGVELPLVIRELMGMVSKVMTTTSYYL